MSNLYSFDEMSNYYGTLSTYEEDGKFYWQLEDYGSLGKQEIPEYLFNALVKFYTETESK